VCSEWAEDNSQADGNSAVILPSSVSSNLPTVVVERVERKGLCVPRPPSPSVASVHKQKQDEGERFHDAGQRFDSNRRATSAQFTRFQKAPM